MQEKEYEQLCLIFNKAQDGVSQHNKLLQKLLSLYGKFEDKDIFWTAFAELTKSYLVCEHRDITIQSGIVFIGKFCGLLKENISNDTTYESMSDVASIIIRADVDVFVKFLISHINATIPIIRYRICEIFSIFFKYMDKDVEMKEDIYQEILENMLLCVRDKSSMVRLMALSAIAAFQNPLDPDCIITKEYIFFMSNDPLTKIRLKALSAVIPSKATLTPILERCHDFNYLVRKMAINIVIEKVPFKYLSIEQKVQLLSGVLNDKHVPIRTQYAKKLIDKWLSAVGGNVVQLLSHLDLENNDAVGALLLDAYFQPYMPPIGSHSSPHVLADLAKNIQHLFGQLDVDTKTHLLKLIRKNGSLQYIPFVDENTSPNETTNQTEKNLEAEKSKELSFGAQTCLLGEGMFYYNHLVNKIDQYITQYERSTRRINNNAAGENKDKINSSMSLLKNRYMDMVTPTDPALFIDLFDNYLRTTFILHNDSVMIANGHQPLNHHTLDSVEYRWEKFLSENAKANFVVRQCLITLHLTDFSEFAVKKKLIKTLKTMIPRLFILTGGMRNPVTGQNSQGVGFYLVDKTCSDLIRTFITFNNGMTPLTASNSINDTGMKNSILGREKGDQNEVGDNGLNGISTHDLSVCDEIIDFGLDDNVLFEEQGEIIWKPDNFKRSSEKWTKSDVDGRVSAGNRSNELGISNTLVTDLVEMISDILDPLEHSDHQDNNTYNNNNNNNNNINIASESSRKLNNQISVNLPVINKALLILKEALKVLLEFKNVAATRNSMGPEVNSVSANIERHMEMLKPLYQEIIIPGLSCKVLQPPRESIMAPTLDPTIIRVNSLECLGLFALLSKEMALQYYAIFIEAFKRDVPRVKLMALKIIFDVALLYQEICQQTTVNDTFRLADDHIEGNISAMDINGPQNLPIHIIGLPIDLIFEYLSQGTDLTMSPLKQFERHSETSSPNESCLKMTHMAAALIRYQLIKGICRLYLFKRCINEPLIKIFLILYSTSYMLNNGPTEMPVENVKSSLDVQLRTAGMIDKFLDIFSLNSKLNQMFMTKICFEFIRDMLCLEVPTAILSLMPHIVTTIPNNKDINNHFYTKFLKTVHPLIVAGFERLLLKIVTISERFTTPTTKNPMDRGLSIVSSITTTPICDPDEMSPHAYLASEILQLLMNLNQNMSACKSPSHVSPQLVNSQTRQSLHNRNGSIAADDESNLLLEYYIDKNCLKCLFKFLYCLHLEQESLTTLLLISQAWQAEIDIDGFKDKMSKKWMSKFLDSINQSIKRKQANGLITNTDTPQIKNEITLVE